VLNKLGDELQVDKSLRFADLDEMMEQARPDIVAIPVATELHYSLCKRVLSYPGVHIEVEKPMCEQLTEADELLEIARANRVHTAVHHQGRCSGSLRAVAHQLARGRVGKLRHLFASDKGYYGGYGLMNIGTHLVNNLLELAGRCRTVSATATVGGRAITPHDVVAAPSGMGFIGKWE
jgi:predicted dehydrogenase